MVSTFSRDLINSVSRSSALAHAMAALDMRWATDPRDVAPRWERLEGARRWQEISAQAAAEAIRLRLEILESANPE